MLRHEDGPRLSFYEPVKQPEEGEKNAEKRTKKRYYIFRMENSVERKESQQTIELKEQKRNDHDANQFVCDNILFRRIFFISSFNLDWFFPPKCNRPTLLFPL